jgi:hypothetical protein
MGVEMEEEEYKYILRADQGIETEEGVKETIISLPVDAYAVHYVPEEKKIYFKQRGEINETTM